MPIAQKLKISSEFFEGKVNLNRSYFFVDLMSKTDIVRANVILLLIRMFFS